MSLDACILYQHERNLFFNSEALTSKPQCFPCSHAVSKGKKASSYLPLKTAHIIWHPGCSIKMWKGTWNCPISPWCWQNGAERKGFFCETKTLLSCCLSHPFSILPLEKVMSPHCICFSSFTQFLTISLLNFCRIEPAASIFDMKFILTRAKPIVINSLMLIQIYCLDFCLYFCLESTWDVVLFGTRRAFEFTVVLISDEVFHQSLQKKMR